MIREVARHCTRACCTNAGLGERGCPTWNRTKIYGFRDRRATVALQGRKWRGPTTRRQSDHDLWCCFYSDGISLGHGEAQSPRIISSAASESSQRAEVYFVFIGVYAIVPTRLRRLLDGLAGSSYWQREDAAIDWYLAPWMTSWLWVKKGCRPVALRFDGLVKSIRPADLLARSR